MISKKHLIHYKLLFFAIVLFYAFSASALKGQDEVSAKFPYVFLLSDSTVVPEPISDEDFYTHASGVVFPVNQFFIPENNPWLRELKTEVEPWAREQGLELKYIELRGAASPEGPVGWNTTLATNRSASLRDKLRSIFDVDYDLISPTVPLHPEDYSSLLYQMRKKNDPDLELVEGVVKKNHNDRARLKKELQSLGGGKLWKRLLREYFPNIRAAKVLLYFKHKDISLEINIDSNIEPIHISDSLFFTSKELEDLPTIKFTPPITSLKTQPTLERIPRRELLSVKTNLLLDFAYMPFGYNDFCPIPNVAIEYYPLHGHFTYGAMFDCPWWAGNITNHKYFQGRNYQVETRYYFRSGDAAIRGIGNGAAFKGTYLSAYANAVSIFGIGWNDDKVPDAAGNLEGHGWQGEGVGAGLGIGYVMPISKNEHWRLEFSAQIGIFWTKYDPYIFGCPVEGDKDDLYYYDYVGDVDLFKKREHMMTWVGPTRIGVTLSYDLLYRHNKKHRISFNAYEKGGKR